MDSPSQACKKGVHSPSHRGRPVDVVVAGREIAFPVYYHACKQIENHVPVRARLPILVE
jgi:hypothetical protein